MKSQRNNFTCWSHALWLAFLPYVVKLSFWLYANCSCRQLPKVLQMFTQNLTCQDEISRNFPRSQYPEQAQNQQQQLRTALSASKTRTKGIVSRNQTFSLVTFGIFLSYLDKSHELLSRDFRRSLNVFFFTLKLSAHNFFCFRWSKKKKQKKKFFFFFQFNVKSKTWKRFFFDKICNFWNQFWKTEDFCRRFFLENCRLKSRSIIKKNH